jgi:undecaprenyl-diphosphatase
LAVVITPPVVAREVLRLVRAPHVDGALGSVALLTIIGAAVAFCAGLLALKWLSRWLESGRWARFGVYCLVAAATVAYLHRVGF